MPGSKTLMTPYGEYFLIGGGVTNYFGRSVRDRLDADRASALALRDTNDLFAMPMGGGLTVAYGHVLLDAL